MANKKIKMNLLRQIIQLKLQGVSNKKIHTLTSISRTTIIKYNRQLDESGFSYQDLFSLSDEDLYSLFDRSAEDQSRFELLESKFPFMDIELKRVGVTRHYLWLKYIEEHKDGYAYSQFCFHYQQWCREKEVTMHFEHKAGEKMYVDYAGSKLYIIDKDTGEEKAVEVFVAVLGASQYTFVHASRSQKKEDFLYSLAESLEYFGGVPQAIVPDNLKSAVDKANKYEPKINESLANFAVHYQTAIIPARPRKPRDKSLVEGAVNIIYRRIFAPLRDQKFFSLTELNKAILDLLVIHNTTLFQGKDHNRSDLFAQVDQAALRPLPLEMFQLKHYKYATVQKNSHIWLSENKHYYSIPFRFVGKKVKVVFNTKQVEVYYQEQRIAFHSLSFTLSRYVTDPAHMPSAHKFLSEWNPEHFLSLAEQIAEPVRLLFEKIMQSKAHPEQAFKSCKGILHLKTKVGKERLVKACERAMYYETYTYFTVKNILDKGMETLPLQQPLQIAIPLHENVRGADYYK